MLRLLDSDLFGNDAAEDEDETVFSSYVLEREEARQFSDPAQKIAFVRAYKGEGKSALLRLTESRLRATRPKELVLRESASSLLPASPGEDLAAAIRTWKKAILSRLAIEAGRTVGFAWTDDAMGLVEEAERSGFKSRSFFFAIWDRLKVGISAEGGTGKIAVSGNIGLNRLGTLNPEETFARWVQDRALAWILIDDVDLNFQNNPVQKIRLAAFFSACRELTNSIPELRIRATIRPNVWTTIKLEFETLSHSEQYMSDLKWSSDQFRALLARRVEGYLSRRGLVSKYSLPSGIQRERALVALVLEDPIKWGKYNEDRPPHVMIHTLAMHRPRWLVELCKTAAKQATGSILRKTDITNVLGEFGQKRILDTIAEFRSQCPEIGELISAFSREKEEMHTSDLLKIIGDKILNHLTPRIVGVIGATTATDVARLLFEIGLFYGRRDFADGSYKHVLYADNPMLFSSRANSDDGLSWEFHPIFRQALGMRDGSGRKT